MKTSLAVFVLLVGCGSGASVRGEPVKRIAIAPFENDSEFKELDLQLSTADPLVLLMRDLRHLRVLDRTQLAKNLEAAKLTLAELQAPTTSSKVAIGVADFLVLGKLVSVGYRNENTVVHVDAAVIFELIRMGSNQVVLRSGAVGQARGKQIEEQALVKAAIGDAIGKLPASIMNAAMEAR